MVKPYDLLIKDANLFFPLGYERPLMDVAVKDGRIAEVKPAIDAKQASLEFDAGGRLLSPGFVDIHACLDTAFTFGERPASDILQATGELQKDMLEHQSETDAESRMRRAASMMVEHGITTVKINLSSAASVKNAVKLKDAFKGKLDILLCVPMEDAGVPHEREAAFFRACPSIKTDRGLISYNRDYGRVIGRVFETARETGLPVDLDIFEIEPSNVNVAMAVLDKLLEKKDFYLYKRIILSYMAGLGSRFVSEDEASLCIAKCARGYVNIASMPSAEMYLQEGNSRGLTRLRELINAGVNVSLASGHLRDAVHPFGNADLLDEALVAAQAHKYGTRMGLRRIFELITYNPAKALGLEGYGVVPGCRADLVLLDADSAEDALISQAKRKLVIKAGNIVAENGQMAQGGKGNG